MHITPTVRYTSQPIMAVRTEITSLGINTWFTLLVKENDSIIRTVQEMALVMWCNSTLGVLVQANCANSVQEGRGIARKGTLEALPSMDIRKLQPWQLDEAQTIWQEFKDMKFQSFHKCAIDPVRIALDERVVRDMFGLGEDAVASVARLRSLLASEPSIHGSKEPALP